MSSQVYTFTLPWINHSQMDEYERQWGNSFMINISEITSAIHARYSEKHLGQKVALEFPL